MVNNTRVLRPECWTPRRGCTRASIWLVTSAMVVVAGSARAADWQLAPTLVARGVYSDNVTLAPAGREDPELATEVLPSVAIKRIGGPLKLDANYGMQGIYYLNSHQDDSTAYQRFNGRLTGEVIDKTLSIESSASYNQYVRSLLGAVAVDNINITGNRVGALSASIAPVLRYRISETINATARFDTAILKYSGGGMSDVMSYGPSVTLGRAREAGQSYWNLDYSQRTNARESAPDTRYESGIFTAGVPLASRLWLQGNVGYYDNNVVTNRAVRNGGYWSAGLRWEPSQYFSLWGLQGPRDREAGVKVSPVKRASLEIVNRHRNVGLMPGTSWNATGRYTSQHSVWTLGYREEVVNNLRLITAPNATSSGLAADLSPGNTATIGSLVNEDFFRRRWDGSMVYTTARKSELSLSAYYERRHYEFSSTRDKTMGGTAALNWPVGLRSVVRASLSAQHFTFYGARSDTIWSEKLTLVRRFQPDVTGEFEVSEYRRESSLASAQYRERRATARLNMVF